jgi:uncharacterized paraquat-inducible protein A
MGILGRRKQNEESVQVSGTGQRVWMENCTRCGCPLTILAVARPSEPLCTRCQASVASEASDASDAAEGRGSSGE